MRISDWSSDVCSSDLIFTLSSVFRPAGNTGTVVAIEELEGDYICVVLTDGLKTELKVNISDVVETSEVTTGLSNLAGYELYDLVVLGQSETAVVVAVGAEHVRVITHQSIEKEVRPQEDRKSTRLNSSH